jgi:RNA polymerase sigma-70 factor, ECF subfamily
MNEHSLDDEMLVERAKQGDRSALNMLVRKYEGRAYAFAFRLCRNSDEAADIVAEAFVRVYKALPSFRSQSTFATWLYRILTNCFLDVKKKDKHRKNNFSLEGSFRVEEGEVTRQLEDPAGTPHDAAESDERMRRFELAVLRLPEFQRAMLVMYHAEQMSYEDIAEALDLPIGTVKSRLNRARLSLREILSKHEELFKV